nr:MAG TPA: hypothetical protein [Caudoviricetes sp.]
MCSLYIFCCFLSSLFFLFAFSVYPSAVLKGLLTFVIRGLQPLNLTIRI